MRGISTLDDPPGLLIDGIERAEKPPPSAA